MNLTTNYLGLKLAHPFVPGAGPMVDDLDTVRRLEDAGAAAICMHSLFEEQIEREYGRTDFDMEAHVDAFSEASSFFPPPTEYRLGPEAYLNQVRKIKQVVSVPVIGSINGTSASGWLRYGKLIQEAGADAIELNVYYVATDPGEDAVAVEQRTLEIVRRVTQALDIPVAVKLSPFFSSLSHFAKELEDAGADAVVLFNRFYQPDIDTDELEVRPELKLSDSSELLLRLRWLAILSGQRNRLQFAVSGGVHTPIDAVKAIMAGANTVQMVSALLKRGPGYIAEMRAGLATWMGEHGYDSVEDMRGCMNLSRCPNPAAFERGNYVRALQTWRP